jgi:hypothetical protein
MGVAERVRQQPAGVGAPSELRISEAAQRFGLGVKPLDGGREGGTALVRVEIAGELEHGRLFERGLSVEVSSCGEDEERASDCRVQLIVRDRNVLPGDVGEDDQIDVSRR